MEADFRTDYARRMAAVSGSADPRLEEAFATVPREAFLGPGPWTIIAGNRKVTTPDADPAHIYQNVLVALDTERNNGEPALHAEWLAQVAPQPGETAVHIGAGSGYYTALLSRLVLPAGRVIAFEIDADLAARARRNLDPYANVSVIAGDAVSADLPGCDIIYVNAGVAAPPAGWLEALRPGGRLVFPWRPSRKVALAMIATRTGQGFTCRAFIGCWFIACVGASQPAGSAKLPTPGGARRTRSIWLLADRAPDDSTTAIIGDVWFSSETIDGA